MTARVSAIIEKKKKLEYREQLCLTAFDFVRATGISFTKGSRHLSITSLAYIL
jgi:hypothetical protein